MDAEEFCRQQWPGLARVLTAWTRDRALGEEVAQEALARVLARWPRVREMASPGGYAHRVAINLATDELVRRRRQPPLAVDDVVEEDPTVGMSVAVALGALPDRQRLAVSLRYVADLSVADTAEAMGCRPGTVKALCHQGLARLRESTALSWHDGSTASTHDGSTAPTGDGGVRPWTT